MKSVTQFSEADIDGADLIQVADKLIEQGFTFFSGGNRDSDGLMQYITSARQTELKGIIASMPVES